MPELVDPAIGDEWKAVIINAYSNAHPQVAAEWSAKLTAWGMFSPPIPFSLYGYSLINK